MTIIDRLLRACATGYGCRALINKKVLLSLRRRSLLNIAKRPLPRLTLRGVGLTSKDAVS
jgi:hypothetical protein